MRATAKLLDRVSWDEVNERVQHEQRNREVYVPPISLFRWWARRPHALMGALIDAAAQGREAPVVSDPFSGGGTVALEAARRGLALYAQDIHPWAVAGLTAALDRVDADALEDAVTVALDKLDKRCGSLYRTICPAHGEGSELVHVFWVRKSTCPGCQSTVYLFPYSLLTVASRRADETIGYFGCSACGAVSTKLLDGKQRRKCGTCTALLAKPDEPLLADRKATCRNAKCATTFAVFTGDRPSWEAALVHRFCPSERGSVAHFDLPTRAETVLGDPPPIRRPLGETIPDGVETSLLQRAGFERWSDLYPPRQLATMFAAADVVAAMRVSDEVRVRLRLAVCGAAEMAGFLSRWDRYYPKAFEAVANHRFPALGFACETNLLAPRGRGTIRRRFVQSVAAARWSCDNLSITGRVRAADSDARRRAVRSGAVLARGSSERQLPSDGSVDLVLTDPPYFDDVQYAELASLFLVWARTVKLVASTVSVELSAEAVANGSRGTGVEEYQSLLTRIFSEAHRTLKAGGRLVLTYHNTDVRAWWALARALHNAGFGVSAVAVADSENSSDHPKRGSRAFTKDLVIECRPTRGRLGLTVLANGVGPEADELRAAGRTVAAGGRMDLAAFIHRFRGERAAVVAPRVKLAGVEPT